MNTKNILSSLLTVNMILLSSCSIFTPYTAPVQQGKIIPQAVIKDIRPGMSKQQIEYLLGSPDIIDPFAEEQWSYVYTFQERIDMPIQQKKIILVFDHNKLSKISGDYPPPEVIYASK